MNKIYEFWVDQGGRILDSTAPFYNIENSSQIEDYFPIFLDFKNTIDIRDFSMEACEVTFEDEKCFFDLSIEEVKDEADGNFIFQLIAKDLTADYTKIQNRQTEFNKINIKNEYLRETNVKLDSQIDYLKSFAFVLSHDFKQPLAILKSFHDLVDAAIEEKKFDDITELNKLARKQIVLLDQMVSSLLKLQKVTSEIMNQTDLQVNLKSLLDQMGSEIYDHESLILENKIPDNLDFKIDPAHLYMVFQNLISNAIKYRKGDEVHVSIESVNYDHFIEIMITDDGIGMAEDIKTSAFEFGFKGIFKESDNLSSHGIGLFTVKSIIELYRGKVRILSEKDKGTQFIIRLANNIIYEGEEPTEVSNQEAAEAISFENVLFIDDSEATNFINRSMFESLGIAANVNDVKNGEEGMKYLLGAEPYGDQELYPIPDIIFLDSSMPIMNGVSFAKAFSKIRNRFKFNIKIAMLSSMPVEKLKKDAEGLGIDYYIEKPLDRQKILNLYQSKK